MKQQGAPLASIKENADTALYYSIIGLLVPIFLIFAGVRAGKTLRLIKDTGAGYEYKGKARAALAIIFAGLLFVAAFVWWAAFSE